MSVERITPKRLPLYGVSEETNGHDAIRGEPESWTERVEMAIVDVSAHLKILSDKALAQDTRMDRMENVQHAQAADIELIRHAAVNQSLAASIPPPPAHLMPMRARMDSSCFDVLPTTHVNGEKVYQASKEQIRAVAEQEVLGILQRRDDARDAAPLRFLRGKALEHVTLAAITGGGAALFWKVLGLLLPTPHH
jgi:hypothetical protein